MPATLAGNASEGKHNGGASEGKHADRQRGETQRQRRRGNRRHHSEGKRAACTNHHSESKLAGAESAKDGSIFVDDLESWTEDDATDEDDDCSRDASDADDRSDDLDDDDFTDESSFESDDDDDDDDEEREAAARRRRQREVDDDEEDDDEEDDEDDEEEEEEETEEEDGDAAAAKDSDADSHGSSSLSSDEFVEDDYSHLKRYVGMGVVVCFGEAWLRGKVAQYQPNDGRRPTKLCGILVKYDKAESEWLRDVDDDPDVQVMEAGVSAAQMFNATEIGDPVIGLYNSDSSIWCAGVVLRKIRAGSPSESPQFVVRFENGQTGQCTCDHVVPVRPTAAQLAQQSAASAGRSPRSVASPKRGGSGGGGGAKSPPWSFVDDNVSTDDDSETSTSSEDEEEFIGHRRSRSRVHTPSGHSKLRRKPSPPSIEFSRQQDQQRTLRPHDAPPKDTECESAVFPRHPSSNSLSSTSSSSSSLSAASGLRGAGGGSGRNLLKQAVAGTGGSRENLLHDPQKLLDLPLEELVEGGFARQVLSDVTRSPRMDHEVINKWSHCKCRYEDEAKTKFYLYEERTGEVLLAAKRIGDDFYISQYAEFPDLVTAKNVQHHAQSACGILHFCSSGGLSSNPATHKRSRGRSRRAGRLARCQLWSTSCDYCDNALAKYVCGPAEPDGRGFYDALSPRKSSGRSAPTPAERELKELKRLGCRQLLADFTQSNVEIKMGAPEHCGPATPTVEARRLTVAVPTLQVDPRTEQTHHCGWCDRRPRDQDATLQLVSAVPEWNDDAQRLTMCFEESHVREHSSKNFLVHEVEDVISPSAACSNSGGGGGGRAKGKGGANKHDHAGARGPKSLRDLDQQHRRGGGSGRKSYHHHGQRRACLQFGKSSKKLFTLSYRYPMSPMQGFGIALSHFNWMPDK